MYIDFLSLHMCILHWIFRNIVLYFHLNRRESIRKVAERLNLNGLTIRPIHHTVQNLNRPFKFLFTTADYIVRNYEKTGCVENKLALDGFSMLTSKTKICLKNYKKVQCFLLKNMPKTFVVQS